MAGNKARRRIKPPEHLRREVDLIVDVSDFLIASGFVRLDLERIPPTPPTPFRGSFWRHPAGVGGRYWQGRKVADFVGVLAAPSGRSFWIECKAPRSRPRPDEPRQVEASLYARSCGALAITVRSVAEVAIALGLSTKFDPALARSILPVRKSP